MVAFLTSHPWLQDLVALFITFIAALAWLRLTDFLARRGIVSRDVSRKLIHIGTGPLYVLCWLLYSSGPQARWLAALVPLLITGQFLLIGLGLIKDQGAVQAMSRAGDPRELLYGPVQYGVIFVVLTLAFWRESPVGIAALMILCGGDGLADLVGRRYGRAKLPFNPRKSWVGSGAMLIAGFLFAFVYVALFQWAGALDLNLAAAVVPLLLISLAATVIEAVSGPDLDNVTITVTALGIAWLLTDATGIWQVPFLA
jgi:phytol kinase